LGFTVVAIICASAFTAIGIGEAKIAFREAFTTTFPHNAVDATRLPHHIGAVRIDVFVALFGWINGTFLAHPHAGVVAAVVEPAEVTSHALGTTAFIDLSIDATGLPTPAAGIIAIFQVLGLSGVLFGGVLYICVIDIQRIPVVGILGVHRIHRAGFFDGGATSIAAGQEISIVAGRTLWTTTFGDIAIEATFLPLAVAGGADIGELRVCSIGHLTGTNAVCSYAKAIPTINKPTIITRNTFWAAALVDISRYTAGFPFTVA